MKAAIIQFPGSNRDTDMAHALSLVTGYAPRMIWHGETALPPLDLIVLPGGFSYGDYLRAGAIAARSPILDAIRTQAERGVAVLGVCNGFQILTEAQLLPGGLMRNASLKFVCRTVQLQVENNRTPFTSRFLPNQIIDCPVAHHDGNYFADPRTLAALEENGQIVFRYANGTNPNGSINDIAGVTNRQGNVLGLMPHPENLVEPSQGGTNGRPLFESILDNLS